MDPPTTLIEVLVGATCYLAALYSPMPVPIARLVERPQQYRRERAKRDIEGRP